MKIVCPNCGADYRISEGKVPASGLVIKCPSCLTEFRAFVDGTTQLESEATDATEPPPLPPAVETDNPAPPPPPPAALDDDFGDFELSDDLDNGPSDIFEAPDFPGQGGQSDAPIDDIAPPPPAGVQEAPVARVSADDFDFNFGDEGSTTDSNSAGSSALGDLFDDLDDLPAPKKANADEHFTDLPAPRAASRTNDEFAEVSDLPGLKTQRDPIGPPDNQNQPGGQPELLLAPEDVDVAPELPDDDDARFFAATGTQVTAASTATAATAPPATSSRKTLWVALAVMVLVGAGVGGLMIAEIGPFSPKKVTKKTKRPKRKVAKKKKVNTVVKKTEVKAGVPDELGTLATQAPTLAEISGYRSAIASLEPSRKDLDQSGLVNLGELYAFGALEYRENTQWAQSASGVVKSLGKQDKPTLKVKRLQLAAQTAHGTADVLPKIEALAHEAPRDAKTLMLLGYGRLGAGDNEGAYNAFQRAYQLDKKLNDAQLRAGALALDLGRVEDARDVFEDLYKKAPGAPRVNTALAALDFREGNEKRALKLLLQTLTLEKGRARPQDRSAAFVLRARIALAAGRDKDAMSDLNSAVRAWPKNSEALDLLSEKHFEAGQFDAALTIFKELEQAGTKSPQTAIKIAQCYAKMGQSKRAIEHLTDAAKRFPKAPEILTETGNVHVENKNFSDARMVYDSALKLNKAYEPAQLKIAQLLVKQAEVDKAMKYLKDALKDSPKSALMNLGLANLQWQIAESSRVAPLMEQAENSYRKALALAPGMVQARRSLVSVLIAQGKASDALKELQKLAKRTDFHGDMNYEFGRAKQALGRNKEAADHFDKALKLKPKSSKYLEYAGVTRYQLGEHAAASKLFKKTIKLNPKNINSYYHLGRIAFAEKKYEGAVQRFKQALELDKLEPTNRYWLGRALEAQGAKPQMDAARQEYNRVAKQVLDEPKLESELCDVFLRRGQMQKTTFKEWRSAVVEFTRYLKCNPKSASAYLYRGQLKEKLGELNAAISDFRKATKLKPRYALAYAANAYTQLRKSKPNEKKIQALLNKAIRYDKTLAYPHYLLCNLVKDRNKSAARRHCQSYLKLAPKGEYVDMAKDLLRSL